VLSGVVLGVGQRAARGLEACPAVNARVIASVDAGT